MLLVTTLGQEIISWAKLVGVLAVCSVIVGTIQLIIHNHTKNKRR